MDERKSTAQIKRIFGKSAKLLLIISAVLATVLVIVIVSALSMIPSAEKIKSCMTTEMFSVELCPGSNNYTRLNQVSQYLQKAVITTEDSAFYQHSGFDLNELKNSIEKNLESGRYARGGSTITQQLAKNMFLNNEKTLYRKALEALIAIRIERVLNKDEILERYLNVVQFGKNVYGVQQAAKFYFSKKPRELTLAESAFLAMLLPNPVSYARSFQQKKWTPFAERRMYQIVDRMYQFRQIPADTYLEARYQIKYFFGEPEDSSLTDSIETINEEDIDQWFDEEPPEDAEPTTTVE